ncbi:DUF481 domain-containing protein [Colwellia echini]|uniref:DUF481 domain-containing protein n=1 Tax=Colwellia echini TaxID=1982103 RepID=A0ABY3MVS1_9GAMM|nr:DUF481 domain-containing protein [Colwellia echini]TYK65301.1 DUF481 domain-containing protein [Colwellia echini]
MSTLLKFFTIGLAIIAFVSSAEEQAKPIVEWSPATPVFSQKYDWLKLKSGEWLKGDIISMYDDELEFDSKEFDTHTFDWEDVDELRSRYDKQIRFDSGEVKQGFLIVKEDHVVIISNGKEQHYPLSDLLSITSAADDRKGFWSGKISLGIDIESGNTNQVNYTVSSNIERVTPYTSFNVDYTFNYSKSRVGDVTQVVTNNSRLTAYIDWFYSYRIFFRVFDFEYVQDLQQNIENRNTLGVSLGYHFINNKRLKWDMTLGPSYQQTEYYNTVVDNNQTSAVIALSTAVDYSITSRIDFLIDYQLQFVKEDSGKRNSYFKASFEYKIHHDFDLDLAFVLNRVAKPVVNEAGEIPKPNDYQLITSLSYNF